MVKITIYVILAKISHTIKRTNVSDKNEAEQKLFFGFFFGFRFTSKQLKGLSSFLQQLTIRNNFFCLV